MYLYLYRYQYIYLTNYISIFLFIYHYHYLSLSWRLARGYNYKEQYHSQIVAGHRTQIKSGNRQSDLAIPRLRSLQLATSLTILYDLQAMILHLGLNYPLPYVWSRSSQAVFITNDYKWFIYMICQPSSGWSICPGWIPGLLA